MTSLSQANEARSAKRHKIETIKDSFSAKEAWERLIGYSKTGYDSITEDDKDFVLKSFGVFDRPATPGRFMIRVRVAGGILSVQQARVLAHVAKRFGKDYIDITTRMQIELRYITIEDMPEALALLESVGLTSYQTGVDNFRNIIIDPLDGLAMDNIIPCVNIMNEIQAVFLKNDDWITTMPRKFNIGISGSLSNRCNIFGQDFALALAHAEALPVGLEDGFAVGRLAREVVPVHGPEVDEALPGLGLAQPLLQHLLPLVPLGRFGLGLLARPWRRAVRRGFEHGSLACKERLDVHLAALRNPVICLVHAFGHHHPLDQRIARHVDEGIGDHVGLEPVAAGHPINLVLHRAGIGIDEDKDRLAIGRRYHGAS